MFYTYRQNNSGGWFDIRPEDGVSVAVIIEASSTYEADAKAEALGIYFNGVDDERDCECCGDRWYPADSWSASEEPEYYGDKLTDDFEVAKREFGMKWAKGGKPEIIVHYADGTTKGFGYE